MNPCQDGYRCMWGRKQPDGKIVCMWHECVLVRYGADADKRWDKVRRCVVDVSQK